MDTGRVLGYGGMWGLLVTLAIGLAYVLSMVIGSLVMAAACTAATLMVIYLTIHFGHRA